MDRSTIAASADAGVRFIEPPGVVARLIVRSADANRNDSICA
jgi:hypothetical protein